MVHVSSGRYKDFDQSKLNVPRTKLMPSLSICPRLEQLQFKQMVYGSLFKKNKERNVRNITFQSICDSVQKFLAIFVNGRTDKWMQIRISALPSLRSPLCFRLSEWVMRKLHCGFIKKEKDNFSWSSGDATPAFKHDFFYLISDSHLVLFYFCWIWTKACFIPTGVAIYVKI